jgi:hypothetical protein
MFPRPIGGASAEEHPMLQFIPFEDDWDVLERLRPEDLIPYRVGLLPEPVSAGPILASDTSLAFTALTATASTAHPVQGGSSGA